MVLLSETQELALKGEFYYLLTPYLDGRPVDKIHEAMSGEATLEEVRRAIEILHDAGFLQESSSLPEPVAAFWSSLGHQGRPGERRSAKQTGRAAGAGRIARGAIPGGPAAVGLCARPFRGGESGPGAVR